MLPLSLLKTAQGHPVVSACNLVHVLQPCMAETALDPSHGLDACSLWS